MLARCNAEARWLFPRLVELEALLPTEPWRLRRWIQVARARLTADDVSSINKFVVHSRPVSGKRKPSDEDGTLAELGGVVSNVVASKNVLEDMRRSFRWSRASGATWMFWQHDAFLSGSGPWPEGRGVEVLGDGV